MPSHRIHRLNEDLKRELSRLIGSLKDPRLNTMLSVMRVEVTSDLSYATIYIGSLEGFDRAKEAVAILTKASGHLRTELSRTMRIRKAPELRFLPDGSAEYANRIDSLLGSLRESDVPGDEDENEEDA